MVLVGGSLGRRVAFALLRPDMHDDRAVLAVADVGQHRQQVLDPVSVDRADIVEAELLEERAAGHHAAREFLGAHRADLERLRQALRELLPDLAQRLVDAAGEDAREIGGHRADRRRDRHVVVVQDDDQARMHGAGVVQRLVGHARRHRAVADDGDDVVRRRRKDRGRSPCRARRRSRSRNAPRRTASYSLSARLVKPERPFPWRKRADAVAPAGQNLVRIGLVADVPDQPVARRIEDVVERDGQLDHAQARRRDGRRSPRRRR